MIATMDQDSGLGDILYLQKAASLLCSEYEKVYWPVIPQYQYVNEYLKKPDNLIYAEPPEGERVIAYDFQSAAKNIHDCGVMEAKYRMAQMDPSNWARYIHLNRNAAKEQELIDLFELKDGHPYALVAKEYATPPETFKARVEPITQLTIINITRIEGFTPFDWCGVIENAEELHLVDTVFTFLVEVLRVRPKRFCLYPRSQHETKVITKGLWKRPWEYIEK